MAWILAAAHSPEWPRRHQGPTWLLSARHDPSSGLLELTAGERCQTGVGQAESEAAASLGYVAPAIRPAHGLFQPHFAATTFSHNGVRVSFEAVGGVKRILARRYVVDLMKQAEEIDEGSK
jgi:hypothetical protein